MKQTVTAFVTAVVLATMSLGAAAPVRAADMQAERKKIEALDKAWVAAVGRKDLKAIVELYATDAVFLPQNGPLATGREAIGKGWTRILNMPGLVLDFRPVRIEVSKAGDMATDIGTYELSFDGKQGKIHDQGKYVVVWKKIGGEWKALADIYNTNLPAQ